MFNYPPDFNVNADANINIGAGMVNAFVAANLAHDVTYRYGFTEQAFNFQKSNFDKGGVAGDPVFLSIQDITGVNNAQFVTLPE